jgi:putative DNA primase/helicase
MFRKYKLIVLEQEKKFFKYNGKCYEECSEESINNLCQEELKEFRRLFTKPALAELTHFAIGDRLFNSEDAKRNQVQYLTLQNGLYDLNVGDMVDHTPNIFTTNLLPYSYDPEAQCPRFLQYLDEVF